MDHGLSIKSSTNLNIVGYADVDWATDLEDRKIVTGYCIYICGNLISWCSKKQITISRSSTEAKYRSIASTTAEIVWIQSMLSELKLKTDRKPII